MHISAKVDYAMRALLELASRESPAGGEALATAQQMPTKFVLSILGDLRRAGLVTNQRGADGGYRLGRPASEITPADVMRAIDGPLAEVRGVRPEAAEYAGAAEHLQQLWVATRAALRSVLETVTLADLAAGVLPEAVEQLVADPDAWRPRRS